MVFTRRDEAGAQFQEAIINENILRYPAIDVLGLQDWAGWLPAAQIEADMLHRRFGAACDWNQFFPGQGLPPFDEAPIDHVVQSTILPLQIAYLTQLDSPGGDDEALIDKLVDELVWFLEYDGIPHRLWLPVGGITLPDEPIRAGDFEIRKMTDDEVIPFASRPNAMSQRGLVQWRVSGYDGMFWPSSLISLIYDGGNGFGGRRRSGFGSFSTVSGRFGPSGS